jgi:hypothetical protein
MAWVAGTAGIVLGWLSVGFYVPLAKAALVSGRATPV